MKKNLLISLIIAPLMLAASLANAYTYGFDRITSNANTNIANQLSLNVTESGGNVLFKISNTGSVESVITGVYFDFGTTTFFLKPDGINWSASNSTTWNAGTNAVVLFSDKDSGGNLIGPAFNVDDWADADSPGPKKGVGIGEFAGFLGTYAPDGNYVSLINALDSGLFRIGLHVQAIGQDSDKFINSTQAPNPVPLPAAAWLFGSALLGFATLSNRRKKLD
ncbi:MAG: VPLPA-CTERM sorting domain-containing protein [Methylotenera sp.]|nr:VPLPA-CTERM sorting domain-containing protein [Methylotenera sp.]